MFVTPERPEQRTLARWTQRRLAMAPSKARDEGIEESG